MVTPGVCGDKPHIAGHRTKVQHVAVWHERMGMSPEEIVVQHPGITLGEGPDAPPRKEKKMTFIRGIGIFFRLLRQAGINFLEDDGMKLSASLSYYAVFSLAPLIIVIAGPLMERTRASER